LTSFFAPNTPIQLELSSRTTIGVLGAKNEVKISPRLVQNGSTGSTSFVKVKIKRILWVKISPPFLEFQKFEKMAVQKKRGEYSKKRGGVKMTPPLFF